MQGIYGKTMCADLVDDLIIVVHKPNTAPEDVEWSRYCTCVHSVWNPPVMRTFVLARGMAAAPNAKQRAEYNKQPARPDHLVAIVHDGSPFARAAITALSWFNPNMRPFKPNAVADALRFLEIPSRPAIFAAIEDMDRHLGVYEQQRSVAR